MVLNLYRLGRQYTYLAYGYLNNLNPLGRYCKCKCKWSNLVVRLALKCTTHVIFI